MFLSDDDLDSAWQDSGLTHAEWVMQNWRHLYPPIGEILRHRQPFPCQEPGMYCRAWVYFLMEDWEVLYVGKTWALGQRFCEHRQYADVTHVALHRVPRDMAEDIEGFYIELLDPPGNVKRGFPGPIEQDLLDDARAGRLYRESPRFKRASRNPFSCTARPSHRR